MFSQIFMLGGYSINLGGGGGLKTLYQHQSLILFLLEFPEVLLQWNEQIKKFKFRPWELHCSCLASL